MFKYGIGKSGLAQYGQNFSINLRSSNFGSVSGAGAEPASLSLIGSISGVEISDTGSTFTSQNSSSTFSRWYDFLILTPPSPPSSNLWIFNRGISTTDREGLYIEAGTGKLVIAGTTSKSSSSICNGAWRHLMFARYENLSGLFGSSTRRAYSVTGEPGSGSGSGFVTWVNGSRVGRNSGSIYVGTENGSVSDNDILIDEFRYWSSLYTANNNAITPFSSYHEVEINEPYPSGDPSLLLYMRFNNNLEDQIGTYSPSGDVTYGESFPFI